MNMPLYRIIISFCTLLMLTGCAMTTTNTTISAMADPVANAKGGTGELYIISSSKAASGIAIGKTLDSDGKFAGDILANAPLNEIFLHTFRNEMKAAGYLISTSETAPPSAIKAIELSSFELTLDQTKGFTRDEAKCRVGFTIEIYKNGLIVKKRTYEAQNSDFAVRNRDQLAQSLFANSLSSILQQAVPETITILEEKKP
jgi:hypothetical protein